jgi:hypothetical protein
LQGGRYCKNGQGWNPVITFLLCNNLRMVLEQSKR